MRSIPYTQNGDELQGLKHAKNTVMPIGSGPGKKSKTSAKSVDLKEKDIDDEDI